jgi:hypothetical protein
VTDVWHVSVEAVVLRLLSDGRLAFREVRAPAEPDRSPDDVAVEAAGCEHGVCHSTSWRWDGPGRLVLTYAVLPDPAPHETAVPLADPEVVTGSDSLEPTPTEVDDAHVVAHAVRHLADLADRDPVIAAAARREPALWDAVLRTAARTATERPPVPAE